MMSTGKAARVELPTDTQILITREFDAPRRLVYRAWTTPELVQQWWAGRRGKVDSVEIDFKVGGRWRYVMTANEGFEVAFHGEYREILPDERIVSTEVYEMPGVDAADLAGTLNTATFTEVDGRTTLTVLVEAGSREVRDAIIDSGMEAGLQESLELLEEVARVLQ
jgi:uncharacterized protein YndB with AHSA1/START domain